MKLRKLFALAVTLVATAIIGTVSAGAEELLTLNSGEDGVNYVYDFTGWTSSDIVNIARIEADVTVDSNYAHGCIGACYAPNGVYSNTEFKCTSSGKSTWTLYIDDSSMLYYDEDGNELAYMVVQLWYVNPLRDGEGNDIGIGTVTLDDIRLYDADGNEINGYSSDDFEEDTEIVLGEYISLTSDDAEAQNLPSFGFFLDESNNWTYDYLSQIAKVEVDVQVDSGFCTGSIGTSEITGDWIMGQYENNDTETNTWTLEVNPEDIIGMYDDGSYFAYFEVQLWWTNHFYSEDGDIIGMGTTYVTDIRICDADGNEILEIDGSIEDIVDGGGGGTTGGDEEDTVYYIADNFMVEILDDGTAAIVDYLSNFTDIVIPETVDITETSYDESGDIVETVIGTYTVTVIDEYAFADTDIETVYIPSTVVNIKEYAFFECDYLTKVTYENADNIYVEKTAFNLCPSLKTYEIVDGEDCITVDGVIFNFDETVLISAPAGLTSYVVPSTVTTINDYAFFGCEYLERITIPDSVNYIGISAFQYCSSLKSVKIPDGATLSDYAFFGCNNLSKATVLDNVLSIGVDVFTWCSDDLVIYCFKDSVAHVIFTDYDIECAFLDCTTPTNFKMALNSTSSIRLSWNKVSDADGYIIEHYTGTKWIRTKKIANPSTNVVSITGLKTGTNYKFRIKSYKMVDGTAYYSDVSSTLTACTKPGKPVAKMTLNSSSSIRIGWDKVSGANGYIVYMKKNGTWTRIGKVSNGSTVTFSAKGLASGTTYEFKVYSYKSLNGKVYYSAASAAFKGCTKPAKVTAKVSATTTSSVTVSWNKVTGANGYIIQQYKDGAWVRVGKTTATSLKVTGLSSKTTCKFRVCAYKSFSGKAYYGAYSATVSGKTK